jgi:hypothetical protein
VAAYEGEGADAGVGSRDERHGGGIAGSGKRRRRRKRACLGLGRGGDGAIDEEENGRVGQASPYIVQLFLSSSVYLKKLMQNYFTTKLYCLLLMNKVFFLKSQTM